MPRALGQEWAVTAGTVWTWMPALAAVITAALAGRGALRDLGRRLARWRVAWWWYAILLLGPAAFWVVVWAVTTLAGWTTGRPAAATEGPAAAVAGAADARVTGLVLALKWLIAAAVVAAWARVSGARTPRSGPVLR